jgi:peptide-methionine (S)-S-oxide reductase
MNFLSDFFGSLQDQMNTGGSYNLGIDYDSLDFPGPEVGAMAVSITAARQQASSTGQAPPPVPSVSPSRPRLELATLAGGCFWGLELALQRHVGIEHTLVGYTQGSENEVRPNYEQVSAGNTGHCEAVLVYYDPTVTSYDAILKAVFFDRIDVTTVDGQGKDFGKQYRTGIYFHTPSQEETARRLLSEEVTTNPRYESSAKQQQVATEVQPANAFWPAEAYHQRYLEKGGRFGQPQSAEKGNTDEIRCYG